MRQAIFVGNAKIPASFAHLSQPNLDVSHALTVFCHLAFHEILAVFAVAEAIAARHVVVIIEGVKNFQIIVKISLIFSEKASQVIGISHDRITIREDIFLFHCSKKLRCIGKNISPRQKYGF